MKNLWLTSGGIKVDPAFCGSKRIARTTVEKSYIAHRQNLPVFKSLYLQP
jgi:hypothetical protein